MRHDPSNPERFQNYIEHELHGGVQREYAFENGYHASVVRHRHSYGYDRGLWELAVLVPRGSNGFYDLCYCSPITGDVIGYLSDDERDRVLGDIANLARWTRCQCHGDLSWDSEP